MKIIIAAFLLLSCFMAKAESISSPSGNITLEFSINERGIPTYQVTYKGIPVIKPSTLGIELNEENSLMDSFRIKIHLQRLLMRLGNLYGEKTVISVTAIMNFLWNWRNHRTDAS